MAQDPVALIAQADKAVQSAQSFLNWFGARTYKYERAVELFTRAATALKLQKNYTEAGSIYEKAAEIQKTKLNEPDDAAQTFQEAYKAYRIAAPEDAARVLSQSINHYLSENNLRRAATQKEWLGETYEELSDRKQARSAYEAAADWYEADKASALANRLLLKVGDLAALDEDYLPAIENFEKVAKHSVSNNLMRFSVKGYLLKAGICHLALDIVGTKRAIQSYKDLDPSFASQKEGQLLDDLAEAVEQGDGDAFANQLFRYDQLSKLDSWHTTILLRIKNKITEHEVDFS